MIAIKKQKKQNHPVDMVFVDGGPCSGKSTGMTVLSEHLIKHNVIPLFVPEASTMLQSMGITLKNLGNIEFQKAILTLQINNENLALKKAQYLANKYNSRAVVICDRGVLSGIAYLPGDDPIHDFRKLLKSYRMDIEDARFRYTGGVLMRTAADGAEEHYTIENNPYRKESALVDAIAQDDRTVKLCWLGHPHVSQVLNIIGGQKISFEAKIEHASKELLRFLGLPAPLEVEDWYLLNSFNLDKVPARMVKIPIKQTYLVPEEESVVERVRMRNWFESYSFFHTVKSDAKDFPGASLEYDRKVDLKLYLALLGREDMSKNSIIKDRYHFLYDGQYFEVDVFGGALSGLIKAERERRYEDKTSLPPFLDVKKDITGDKTYSNYNLANKNREAIPI